MLARRSYLALLVLLVIDGAGCGSSSRPDPEPGSDEAILALKPEGTNAVVIRATGYGTGTLSIDDPSQTCLSFDPEDSHYSLVCWAYVPVATPGVAVTAAPTNGSRFTGWGGPCAGSAEGTCVVPMDRDRILNVGFAPGGAAPKTEYGLSVHVLGFVDGDISAPPEVGLRCQPSELVNYARTCDAVVPRTTPPITVTLTATPASGTRFSGWGGSCSGTGTCTVTMDRDRGVTAAFTRDVRGAAPVIASFISTPSSVTAGDSAVLSWSVDNATSIVIAPGVGPVTGTSASVTPASTTTYTLSASNAHGTTTRAVTLAVTEPLTVVRLTTDPADDFSPAWRSDGDIVFQSNRTSDRSNGADAWLMHADGTDQHEIVHVRVSGPLWWGDAGLGAGIVVLESGDLLVNETQYFFEFMRVSTSTATAFPIIRTVWDGSDAYFTRLLWVPGGQNAVHYSYSSATGMVAWDSIVSSVHQLRTAPYGSLAGQSTATHGLALRTLPLGGTIQGMSYSPDGTRLAVAICQASCGAGRGADIFVLDASTGSVLQQLTATGQTGTANSLPRWSPDGEWIAFSAATGATEELWLASTTAGTLRRLEVGVRASQPAWSVDGRDLAFVGVSADGNRDVWAIRNVLQP